MRLLASAAVAVLLALVAAYVQLSISISRLQQKPLPRVHCDQEAGGEEAVARFAKLLTYNTISSIDALHHVNQPAEFEAVHKHLRESYPFVWTHAKAEQVCEYSLLVTWQGANESALPVLFVSHVDVVPVGGNEDKWTHPPFGGVVADGCIWGRGAVDVKISVAAILESWNQLMKDGHTPERTMILAVGHDEETSGRLGAGCMAGILKDRGVTLEAIFDEGGCVASSGISFIKSPVALIATAEKGYTDVLVGVHSPGGHSSMPPTDGSTSAAILSRVINHAENHRPAVALLPPATDFVQFMAPYAPLAIRPLLKFCDKWPLNWLVARVLYRLSPETAAMVSTTVATTNVRAGVSGNVLPLDASAVFNIRTLPGTVLQELVDYFYDVGQRVAGSAAGKISVKLRPPESGEIGNDPSNVTSSSGSAFATLMRAVQEAMVVEGEAPVVAPYLVMGGTDSKHYAALSVGGTLRFVPMALDIRAGELARVHGIDERIEVPAYKQAVCAYKQITKRFGAAQWAA
eukprot:evm.model.scf_1384.3 EVM.evm.TU.scf_1384.3   scf_1384:16765-23280(+)